MHYELYWERPEILGSGSDIQYIKSVKTIEEAMELYNSGKCNRVEQHSRENNRRVVKVYDYATKTFE